MAALSGLVRRENDSLSELLAHLAELDRRELCLALGYSSLFAYCTEALGFCKSSAGRRIAAARVCREYPEAFTRVAAGELSLSVLCALRPHLHAENARELFTACSRKSYEQVEELLAARFPKPDVRDLIRRLPATAVGTPHIGSKQIETTPIEIEAGARLTEAMTKPAMAQITPRLPENSRPPAQPGTVKPLSAERFSVNFTADKEFRELLEEVRALLSHAEPKGDLLDVLKKRFGVGRKPRRVRLSASEARAAAVGSKHTRHVAAAVLREVYVRDQGCCTFCADDGRRCGDRRLLQLDHAIPHAEGGEPTVANLRLRCRTHNLHTARAHFGREYVRAAAERANVRSVRVSTRSDSTALEGES